VCCEEKEDNFEHRDVDLRRSKYYREILNATRRKYLETSDRKDGPLSYLHLKRLRVHPKWQRHGAGTLLSKWGIDIAKEQSLDIGLYAMPMGENLYKALGFKCPVRRKPSTLLV